MTAKPYRILIQNNLHVLSATRDISDDCDCAGGDCACSISDTGYHELPKMSDLNLADIRNYKKTPTSQVMYLCDELNLYFGPHHRVVAMNCVGQELLNSFDFPNSQDYDLTDIDLQNAIKNLIGGGLLVKKSWQAPLIQEESQTLTAWFHVTDRCNLRCSYCYLPHVREDMSEETGKASIDAIFRSAMANGFSRVKIKYAGGEPLLRFNLIITLHQYAQQLALQNSMALEGVVLSNGTLLTTEIVEFLKLLSLRLMISLDGLGESHDRHRPYAGGRGSFSDVSTAVEIALAGGLVPNISVTVSGRTADSLPQLISWILELDLPFSLNFYRENELSASHIDMKLDEEKIINGMLAAFKVIETNIPRRSLLSSIVDRANLSAPHQHTCGVGQNYLVFDQNGQVAKCQMHIRKPITNMHVKDPLAIIRADQIGIQNLSVEEKEGCRTCEWKYWCTGGCSLATYRATGRYDVKSPNCNIYKALYPEAVRLEGLRLLKYADDPEVVIQ